MSRRIQLGQISREITEFGADNRRWLMPALLLCVLNLVFYFGLTARSANRLEQLENEIADSNRELMSARKVLDRNDRKRALGSLVERELDDLHKNVLLRYGEHFQNVRLELQGILKQVSIAATQISYGRTDFADFRLIQDNISFPLKGDYYSLRKLLNLIEQSEQFLIIDSIQLADSTNKGKELNLNISLITFYYEPDLDGKERRKRPI
ncbi:hypothetical protein ACFLU6_15325 [Acidobacteriota bacterium]